MLDGHDVLRLGYAPEEFITRMRSIGDPYCSEIPLRGGIAIEDVRGIESVHWNQEVEVTIGMWSISFLSKP